MTAQASQYLICPSFIAIKAKTTSSRIHFLFVFESDWILKCVLVNMMAPDEPDITSCMNVRMPEGKEKTEYGFMFTFSTNKRFKRKHELHPGRSGDEMKFDSDRVKLLTGHSECPLWAIKCQNQVQQVQGSFFM